jgi:hypothetical protein
MVRFSIFNNLSTRLVYFQTFIHGIILWSLLYYLPIYYEAVKDFSPILTGVAVFPETFTVAPASVVVGVITSITGKYKWALWAGWTLTTLGMGLMYLQDVHTSTAAWIFLNLVPGLGTGILFAGMGVAIPASTAAVDNAHAVAFFSFFRAFGRKYSFLQISFSHFAGLASPLLLDASRVENSQDNTSTPKICSFRQY